MKALPICLLAFLGHAFAQQPDAATFLYNFQNEAMRQWIWDTRVCMRQFIQGQLTFGNRDTESIVSQMLYPCGDHLKKVVNQSGGDGNTFVRTLALQEILSFPNGTFDAPKPGAGDKQIATPPPSEKRSPSAGYVVALGMFSDAGPSVTKLAQANISFFSEVVQTERGAMTRLRAGPFKSATEAEKVRATVKTLGFVPGTVTRRD